MPSKDDVITMKQATFIISIILIVAGAMGAFYGGIAIAKDHADKKVSELRKENKVEVENLNKRLFNRICG